MTPVNLNEFLITHPAILKLRLQVDEAAVAVKHAHVASLRALSDKNAPLITRWHEYFRECNRGHQFFIGAFYREVFSLRRLRSEAVRAVDAAMLKRKIQLDSCMMAIERAEEVCDRAFFARDGLLLLRCWQHFEGCRANYLDLLAAFRREFLT